MNTNTYKLTEYTDGEEYGLVGSITTQNKKFVCAEILNTILTDPDEVIQIKQFLDEVAKEMGHPPAEEDAFVKQIESFIKNTEAGIITCPPHKDFFEGLLSGYRYALVFYERTRT